MSLLAHRLEGTARETVLFLNGGLMTYAAWQPYVDGLGDEFRALRCDLRGQLLSPGGSPERVAGHVEDVVALLDALAMAAVHVVGTSFGAFVGLLLAARHPERVTSLVAIAATARVDEACTDGAREMRRRALQAAAGGDGRRLFDLIRDTSYSPAYLEANRELLAARREAVAALPAAFFEGAAALAASLPGLDLTAELGRIACPTLVIEAEQDATFKAPQSAELAARIPGARLETLPACGHAAVVEKPSELIGRLRAFLRSARATAA